MRCPVNNGHSVFRRPDVFGHAVVQRQRGLGSPVANGGAVSCRKFDVFPNRSHGLGSRSITVVVDQFVLQATQCPHVPFGIPRRRETSLSDNPCSVTNFTASSRNSIEYCSFFSIIPVIPPFPTLTFQSGVSIFFRLPHWCFDYLASTKLGEIQCCRHMGYSSPEFPGFLLFSLDLAYR